MNVGNGGHATAPGALPSTALRERVAAGVSPRPGEGLQLCKDIAHTPPHPKPSASRTAGGTRRIHGAGAKTRLHWVSARPAFLSFGKETAAIFWPSNLYA